MVDLSVGLQRPMGFERAKPCGGCGALVHAPPWPHSEPGLRCTICSGRGLGNDEDWPASGGLL